VFDYQSSGEISRLLENWDLKGNAVNGGLGPQAVVLTFYVRESGTRAYQGKTLVLFPGGGKPRFLSHISTSPSYPADLQRCFWDANGNGLSAATPQQNTPSLTWNRDDTSLGGGGGYSYKQNMGAAFDYTTVAVDGQWHRFTVRFDRGASGVYGRGRLEAWADGVKTHEYIGDDPARCEYGKVYVPHDVPIITGLHFPGPAAFNWLGGVNLEYDAIRIWSR
jgi:hypothetical protein